MEIEALKWKTHIAIVRRVFLELEFAQDALEIAVQGVIDPDKQRGYRETHHGAPNSRIMSYIWAARDARLQNMYPDAVYNLASGLHFVHDRSTGKGFRGLYHEAIEANVSELAVPEDAVHSGFAHAISNPLVVEKFVAGVRYSNEPERIIWNATFASALLVKAVFDLGDVATGEREMQKNLAERRRGLEIAAFALLVVVGICLVLGTVVPLIFGFAAFIPAWVHDARSRKLRRWFALGRSTPKPIRIRAPTHNGIAQDVARISPRELDPISEAAKYVRKVCDGGDISELRHARLIVERKLVPSFAISKPSKVELESLFALTAATAILQSQGGVYKHTQRVYQTTFATAFEKAGVGNDPRKWIDLFNLEAAKTLGVSQILDGRSRDDVLLVLLSWGMH